MVVIFTEAITKSVRFRFKVMKLLSPIKIAIFATFGLIELNSILGS